MMETTEDINTCTQLRRIQKLSAFELIPQKHVFYGTLSEHSERKNRLCNRAPAK